MKHVFTIAGACEAWVNKTSTHGRGEGIRFADLTSIKSYGTIIGSRVSDSKFLVLYGFVAPTHTTSRHVALLRGNLYFRDVTKVFSFPRTLNIKDPAWLAEELERTVNQTKRSLESMSRARLSVNAMLYSADATTRMDNFDRLAAWAESPDLGARAFAPLRDELAMLRRRWETKGQAT